MQTPSQVRSYLDWVIAAHGPEEPIQSRNFPRGESWPAGGYVMDYGKAGELLERLNRGEPVTLP